jgi:putative tricarboxylic transport membrane protein
MLRMTSYKPYGVAFGAALALLGAAMIWVISLLPDTAAYAAVGPKMFPRLVGGGLILTGLAVIREAMSIVPGGEDAIEYDVLPILAISAGLIFAAFALERLGWILTATVVFFVTAWALGERRRLATIAIGLALSGGTYLLFNYALQLSLPAGILRF